MTRLAFTVTHPITADRFLRGQLGYFRERGYEVHLISTPGERLSRVADREGVTAHGVPMAREMSLLRDLLSLRRMTRLLHRLKPAIVQASTPKAGLLGTLAARSAGVPHRIYLLRGLRLETVSGLKRALLRRTESAAASAASEVVCVSPSLRDRYLAERLCPPGKIHVLRNGSSNGVDVAEFTHCREVGARERARRRLELPSSPIVGFFGRLTRDKGVEDLVAVFTGFVLAALPEAILVLVGDEEPGDPLPGATRQAIAAHPSIRTRPFADGLHDYYAAVDLVAFPSYREGMPNVPLEAAACELPTVGYAATGVVDAVENGATGRLVPVGDRDRLGEAILSYLSDPDERRAHGLAARRRVEERFAPRALWHAWDELFAGRLAGEGAG